MAMPYLPPLCPATTTSYSRRPANRGSTSPWGFTRSQRPASSSPPSSRSLTSDNWRAGAGPQRLERVLECVLGRVFKLPEQSEVPVTSRFHQAVVGHGQPWDHPVVITRKWKDLLSGEWLVKFRYCTSWGGRGLAAAKPEHQHRYYVVADQTTLAFGKFAKDTYVNCSPGQELTIEFKHLQAWTRKEPIQFSQEALDSFNKNERSRRDSGYSDYRSS
ncbi:hypothetical protein N0V86_006172 [Didymella sp. IMI 355093]|nr:hypothetical protein N0V86_006172 [Didymella sp. IMI 355093]